MMSFQDQDRPSSPMACPAFCHPEPFASLKGNLREGSVSMGREILPLRCAQGFGSCAQDDRTGVDCYNSLSRSLDKSGTYSAHSYAGVFCETSSSRSYRRYRLTMMG